MKPRNSQCIVRTFNRPRDILWEERPQVLVNNSGNWNILKSWIFIANKCMCHRYIISIHWRGLNHRLSALQAQMAEEGEEGTRTPCMRISLKPELSHPKLLADGWTKICTWHKYPSPWKSVTRDRPSQSSTHVLSGTWIHPTTQAPSVENISSTCSFEQTTFLYSKKLMLKYRVDSATQTQSWRLRLQMTTSVTVMSRI